MVGKRIQGGQETLPRSDRSIAAQKASDPSSSPSCCVAPSDFPTLSLSFSSILQGWQQQGCGEDSRRALATGWPEAMPLVPRACLSPSAPPPRAQPKSLLPSSSLSPPYPWGLPHPCSLGLTGRIPSCLSLSYHLTTPLSAEVLPWLSSPMG